MNTMRRSTMLAVLLAPVALVVGSQAALAHARLRHAEPAAGEVLTKAPEAVTILFSEDLEPRFSHIEVRDAAGARVDAGSPHIVGGDAKRLAVGLKPLAPGVFQVNWQAISVDTHKTEGSYTFTLHP
jgi:methionine-rich copper-binding protein CopC